MTTEKVIKMKKLCKILFIIFLFQAFLPRLVMADANQDIQYIAAVLYLNAKEQDETQKQELANQILNRFSYLSEQNGSATTLQTAIADLGYFSSFSDWQWAEISSTGSKERQAWQECLSVAQSTVSSYYANDLSENSGKNTPSTPDWARGGNSIETIENHTVGQSGTAPTGNSDNSLLQSGSAAALGASIGNISRACSNPTPPRSSLSSEYQDPGMFSKDILINMKKMMEMVYKSLGQIFMLAHGLICFANHIAYICIEDPIFGSCIWKLSNFSYLICGIVIYIVVFFISMTIGMYFVDVSFKLGFAVLFLPITLALWPFPPTKDKLNTNFSIVIRNAMLFTLVAIGISYAVLLIKQGVIGNQSDWKEFWDVVDGGRGAYLNNVSHLSEKYSLDSVKIIVIIFCLIFGFKIISSSIDDYLDTFFSDSMFGGSSPMHHMGTQALGYVKSRTVDPIAGYARDVALTQTGRAVSAVGQGMGRMAQGDFSDIKNIGKGIKNVGSAIRHPGKTFNKLSSKVGEKANQAVHALGNVAAEAYDTVNILRHNQQTREEKTAKFKERVNNVTDKLGDTLQYGISNGNVLRHPAKTLAKASIATGAVTKAVTQATANITKKVNHIKNTVIIRDKYERAMANEIQDGKIDNVTQKVEGAIDKTATTIGAGIEQTGDKARNYVKEKASELKEGAKKGATIAAAAVLNAGGSNVTPEQVRAGIHELRNQTKDTLNQANKILHTSGQLAKGVGQQLGEKVKPVIDAVDNFTRPTETTLKPSKLLHPVIYPKKTYKTIKQLAKKGIKEIKETEGNKEKAKLIMKKGGQIVLRSARATIQETTQATVGLAGKFLDGIGKSMQDNRKKQGERDYWAEKQRQEEEEEQKKLEESIRNQTLIE